MNAALLLVDWLTALTVLAFALRNVNAMSRATSHRVRAANVVLAISAAAIVFAPAYGAPLADEARDWAHLGVLLAVAVLLASGRRAVDRAIDKILGV
jgi:hypothetical protein